MAGAKGIKAGRAYIEIGAEDKKLLAGLKKATNRLRSFGQSVGAVGSQMARVGAIALAPLLGAAKVFSSLGDTIAKMAKRTGLSVETLSEMRFVASQTGTSLAGFETAVKRMQRTIYDAERGLSTAVDVLSDLGLAVADLDGLAPEEQFKLLADRIAKIEDPTTKAAIAMTLFGRSGADLLPMLEQGATGIEALQKEARQLGLTITTKSAEAAEHFTDRLDKLTKVAKQATYEVGAALAPELEKMFSTIIKGIQNTREWVREQGTAIRTVLKMTSAVLGLGVALVALGKTAKVTGAILKGTFALAASTTTLTVAGILGVVGLVAAAFGVFDSKIEDTSESMGTLTKNIKKMDLPSLKREVTELNEKLDELQSKFVEPPMVGVMPTKKRLRAISDEFDRTMRLKAIAMEEIDKREAAAGTTAIEAKARTEAEWARRVHQLQLKLITDEHTRAAWLLHERYEHEYQQALAEAANDATLHAINKAYEYELAALGMSFDRKRAQAKKRILDAEQARSVTIEELSLRMRFKGVRLERELLNLKEREALAEAKAAGLSLDRVKQEYALRRELFEQGRGAGVTEAMEMRMIGTFNPAAIRGLESSNLGRRTATATERTATNTRDMLDIMRGGALAFT